MRTIDRKLENQQNGEMKTTLDLPDYFVKQVKLRALQDGRKLKDAVADLLRRGLAAAANEKPELELTPERVADILLAQEAGWHHDAARLDLLVVAKT
jgi:hypothetical protein